MNELFPGLPEMKSPRLQWMERHGVTVTGPNEDDEFCAKTGDGHVARASFGQSEDEAICGLANRNGWKLWNEEGAP